MDFLTSRVFIRNISRLKLWSCSRRDQEILVVGAGIVAPESSTSSRGLSPGALSRTAHNCPRNVARYDRTSRCREVIEVSVPARQNGPDMSRFKWRTCVVSWPWRRMLSVSQSVRWNCSLRIIQRYPISHLSHRIITRHTPHTAWYCIIPWHSVSYHYIMPWHSVSCCIIISYLGILCRIVSPYYTKAFRVV